MVFGLFYSLTAHAQLQVGQTAPSFALYDQHQHLQKLDDYRGQWVVLYFYPKDDTPGCTAEACSFRDNINKLIAKQAVILGVSVDNTDDHKTFAAKYNLPFSLLADPEGKVAKQYDALLDLKVLRFAKRHSFIIDPQGRIVRIYRSVDPQRHVAEILKDLEDLQQKTE